MTGGVVAHGPAGIGDMSLSVCLCLQVRSTDRLIERCTRREGGAVSESVKLKLNKCTTYVYKFTKDLCLLVLLLLFLQKLNLHESLRGKPL